MKLIGMLIQQRGYENGTEQKAEAAKQNGYPLHKVTLEALEIQVFLVCRGSHNDSGECRPKMNELIENIQSLFRKVSSEFELNL